MNKLNKKFRQNSNNVTTQGVIHVHPKGFAFVSPDDQKKYPEDIFIPKHLKGNAVDGDRVEVAILAEKKADKGPEGFVKSVLDRAKEQLVGIVWIINPKGHYLLYIQSLGKSKTALVKRSSKAKYHIGDRLLVKVMDWGDEKAPALCSVIKKIGSIDQPQTDIPAAIKDFGIRKEFPKEVIHQVKKLSSEVEKRDLKGREDLTHLETFTIDPDTARDFDDALSLTEDKKGHFHLSVHIADVSHYVEEGTPLDKEAKKRSNSTYFPGECVPMLPEELSNHLCSLKEKVIRLTISVIIELGPDGSVLNYKIVRGYINSQKRYTYKEAKEILDQKKKSPHYDTLKRMEKLCLLLKKKRFERGSVDLALSEVVIKVDKKGKPSDYEVVEYDITHQLVEEFMLKANELVAEEFMKRGQNAVFRIHEPPGEDNLSTFYNLARSLGFPLPNKVEISDVQKVFELAKNTPYAEQLSIAYIRSMKLAVYSKENVGHYGLSLENYCHFTSPIRRYSDLVVHRLLFSTQEQDLDQIAKNCSERERVSFKAEVSVVMMKKLRLLEFYQKKEPDRIYSAVVSKVKPFGIYFEVSPIQYEGFLHISALYDDYFEYHNESLVGQNSGKSYKIGTSLDLYLEEIDLITMESKWALSQPKKKEKLPLSFFQEEETLEVAQKLLGKYLFTHFDGKITGGMIIETEAYKGAEDQACHAYNNRRTKRTEVMFSPGGVAYVYFCYGMHHLFNIVTHKENIPHAILIRALKPTHGIETMLKRRKKASIDKTLSNGPATTTQALGIHTNHSGLDLTGDQIWLEDHGISIPKIQILATPRIGIDYAGKDKDLPYRFLIKRT